MGRWVWFTNKAYLVWFYELLDYEDQVGGLSHDVNQTGLRCVHI